MFRRFVTIVLCGCLLLGARAAAASAPQHWIVVSDIHFDPFADAKLVARLNAAPAEHWRAIFQGAGAQPFSNYGADTNYALLESALESMRLEDANPETIIVTGDFLAHDFRKNFERTAKVHDEATYDTFVDKTIAFLAGELRGAFPRAHFIPVIGNNDSYCGDYDGAPGSPFFAHMASAWLGAVDSPDAATWTKQFSLGGYYSTSLPVAGARAIVLNDVFWSSRYKNACGDANATPGADEMTWLRAALAQNPQHTPVWIVAHIPPGPDVFSSLFSGAQGLGATMMLADAFNDPFLDAIGAPDAHIAMAIAGHTHMNSFRIVAQNAGAPVTPMLLVPAISPAFAGNPAYTIVDVDSESATVSDSRVFVLDDLSLLAKDGKRRAQWRREYDFTSVFGHGTLDAEHLDAVERAMFDDDRLRARFEQYYDSESGRAPITDATWRAYWCGNQALRKTSYTACAMPRVEHSLPAQPSAPPAPKPSARP